LTPPHRTTAKRPVPIARRASRCILAAARFCTNISTPVSSVRQPTDRRFRVPQLVAALPCRDRSRRNSVPVTSHRWQKAGASPRTPKQWRWGPAEFVDAFEWRLSKKAESWLEHKKNAGPVGLDDWATALWKDSRVQAVWPVAAENYAFIFGQGFDFESSMECGDSSPLSHPATCRGVTPHR
jgi:hypothetical protein